MEKTDSSFTWKRCSGREGAPDVDGWADSSAPDTTPGSLFNFTNGILRNETVLFCCDGFIESFSVTSQRKNPRTSISCHFFSMSRQTPTRQKSGVTGVVSVVPGVESRPDSTNSTDRADKSNMHPYINTKQSTLLLMKET